ncbi:Synaptophysin-like protein 1 [Lemmus lemmus]
MSAFQIKLNSLKEALSFIKILEWFASILLLPPVAGLRAKQRFK